MAEGGEVEDDVGLDEAPRLIGNHQDTPRRLERGSADRRERGPAGARRELSAKQGSEIAFVAKIHAGIVVDVGFGDGDPGLAEEFREQGQAD
jgi:hypothetical protein